MPPIRSLGLWFLGFPAGLALAAPINAATLSISPDKAFYAPGEAVTLTVVGNTGGATDIGLFAKIVFDPAGLIDPSAITLTPQTGGSDPWIGGYLGCPDPLHTPGTCWLINYITGAANFSKLPMDPVEQTLAVVTGTAGAPGTYAVEWAGDLGNELDFFGLTSGPGANLIIINTSFSVVPEPRAALLLCVGLVALSVRKKDPR